MTIFGLREVDDRTQAVDPSNVSGNISVLLDVQYNDETVTNVDLTLGEEVISCRGASSDAAAPTGVMPTLAESGGSVEIECFFDTDQVAGECMGMQMMPRFANGEHELGARITTADGTTRDALATQMITLKNSNYVMIDHNPGKSMVVAGVPYYGGPTTEDNVNTFDVCPVAFDGTVVGAISLRAMTDTQDGNSLSFRAHRRGSTYGEYWGDPRRDSEAPFTFTAHSDWNGRNALSASFGNDGGVEDINPAREGSGGHWIIQDGAISDPDGVDISSKFVPGDAENNLTKIGPLYFDFNAPRVTDASEVTIEGKSIEEAFYSGNRALGDGRSQRVWISNVSEGGSGGQYGSTTQIVAVGDCSISANTDTGERGAGTDFQALFEDVNTIGELPEDDPYGDDLSDDGGVQCYTAELQSITDPIGNARALNNVRIRSANNFGVDKTGPEIDDLVPDEELVLMDGAVLTFEVDDPDLETGENSSGLDEESPWAYWGPSSSWSQRYFYSTQDGAPSGVVSNVEDGVVTIATNTGDSEADKERRYVVVALVQDNAVPPNRSSTSFAYTRDSEGPAVSLSKSQSDIGNIGTQTVTVGVGGTISDKNVIKVADLSIRMIAADAGADACMAAEDLSQGRTGRVVRNKRDLENDSNKIEFDESFTIRRPTGTGAGPETYCFWLASADVAVEANGRGDGNAGDYELGRFSVGWPEGPAAPPPGPTFDFSTRTDNADPATASALTDALEVTEGDGTGVVYHVTLKDVATAPTAAAPLSVTASAPPGLTINIDGGTAGASQTLSFTGATDTVAVTVTADHDGDIDSEALSVNHTATGYTAASVGVTSMDDDFMISASVMEVRENADVMNVLVTVTAGSATAAERTATVAATGAGGAVDADFAVTGTADVAIAAMATKDTFTLMVDAVNDTERGELGEMISLGVSGSADPTATYYMPAEITILDDDPDFQLSLSQDEVAEGAGQVTVTITATPTGTVDVRARTVFTLATTGTATSGTDYSTNPTTITLTVDVGTYDSSDSFTTDVVLTIEEDDDTTTNTTIVFDDADGEGGLTVSENTTLTITDNDSSGDQ